MNEQNPQPLTLTSFIQLDLSTQILGAQSALAGCIREETNIQILLLAQERQLDEAVAAAMLDLYAQGAKAVGANDSERKLRETETRRNMCGPLEDAVAETRSRLMRSQAETKIAWSKVSALQSAMGFQASILNNSLVVSGASGWQVFAKDNGVRSN